jgi:drug/metabolite transporter (DMT)-like permease
VHVWPFVLLCLLSASRWLVEGAVPSSSSTLASEAAGCLMAAVLVWPLSRGRAGSHDSAFSKSGWTAAGLSALVLTGPAIATLIAGRFLDPNNSTLGLALCPVVIAVVASVMGSDDGADLTGLLWPGLAGVAGLLLLLPQPTFSGFRPWVGLMAIPVLVGLAAGVWGRRFELGQSASRSDASAEVSLVLVLSALLFGTLGVLSWRAGAVTGFSFTAAALDGAAAALTLVSLVRLGPVRWSSQFLFIPLMALLEGVFFLRPFLDWRSYLAFALLAVGGAYPWIAHGPHEHGGVIQDRKSRVPEA